jgi:hypothetical protein
MDFDQALQEWFAGCRKIFDDYLATNFPNNPKETLELKVGPKYVKVIQTREGQDGGAVWAFVDKTTGDVLKPASWRAPAKHARGNIFDEHKGLKYIGPYGPAYLK